MYIYAKTLNVALAAFCAVHWIVAMVWLAITVEKNTISDILRIPILGLVYIFTYINTERGGLRMRYARFNFLIECENIYLICHGIFVCDDAYTYFINEAYKLLVLHLGAFVYSNILYSIYVNWLHVTNTLQQNVRKKMEDAYPQCLNEDDESMC